MGSEMCIRDRSKVGDKISDELVEAILYSFIKYRTQALKELPAEQGAPLEGPQNIKEIFNNIKAELQDLAHKVGESFVQGMAKSFAENMPKFMVTRPVQAAEKTDSLLSLIPSRRTVLEMLLGEKNKKSLLANASTELGEEEEENPHLTEEIRAIEEELASINEMEREFSESYATSFDRGGNQ